MRKKAVRASSTDALLGEVAARMVGGESIPRIAQDFGITPHELRDLIFTAHRAGEWARLVYAAQTTRR